MKLILHITLHACELCNHALYGLEMVLIQIEAQVKVNFKLTSHADINWVQSCCKHFDNDLIGVVDNGETGISGEP